MQDLVRALTTLRSPRPDAQIFGMSASNLIAEERPAIEATVVEALVAWRARFDSAGDIASLLDLDKTGRALDVPGLCVDKRFPLRCDPLGTREDLPADWLRRLEMLDAAIAGRRRIDIDAVHVAGPVGKAPRVSFGAPDDASLYDFVIRYETRYRAAFPREMAAFWATSNGLFVDDAPLLAPISGWSDEDDGWRIGCGGYVQGSLTAFVTEKAGLLAAQVVDRDDDGVVRATYENFGEFVTALLGRETCRET